tara:strand:- start:179 stop:1561 length:1383 start_codon:yes stop_codon:yes gene_type:complete
MSTRDELIKLALGASGSGTQDLTGGALQNLILQQIAKPRDVERDKNFALLQAFAKMGEEASKPGATALGAGFAGLREGVKDFIASEKRQEKKDLQNITLLSSLEKLGNVKRDAYRVNKTTSGVGVKNDIKYLSQKEFNALSPLQRESLVPYSADNVKVVKSEVTGRLMIQGGPHDGKRYEDDKGNVIDHDKTVIVKADSFDINKSPIKKEDETKSQENELKELYQQLNPKQVEQLDKIAKEYTSNAYPLVKRYVEIAPNIGNILTSYDQAYKAARPGAADMSMIFSFMKMLDPGSVVREGEFLVASKTGGQADFAIQYLKQIQDGSMLSDLVRRSFKDMALSLYTKAVTDMKVDHERIINRANLRGIPEAVTRSLFATPVTYNTKENDGDYQVRLPKVVNKETMKEMFLLNRYTLDDIYYLKNSKRVQDDNKTLGIIVDIMKDIRNRKFQLEPLKKFGNR